MKRILIADDNPHVVRILEGGVRRVVPDSEISTAADGAAALERTTRGDVDLVILDLYMPGLDGNRVIDEVRARPELAALRILVVTAGGADAVDAALQRGADEALQKPLRLLEVADAVRRLLRLEPA